MAETPPPSDNGAPAPAPAPPPLWKMSVNVPKCVEGTGEDDLKSVKLTKVDESQKHYVSKEEFIKNMFGDQYLDALKPKKSSKIQEKTTTWRVWHGALGDKEWKLPKCVARTNEVNRADQGNTTNASEYLDDEEVLEAKMKIVADLIKKAKFCVAYTGAGISRASGIADYGTKAKDSVMGGIKKLRNPAVADPTFAHHVLAALEKHGLIHYYIQQNHDGLPQKAGFPQEKMNEIHGAWFDPSNPVISFDGHLRGDLFQEMVEFEKKIDFCLCLGTSLSGMNADRCVYTPCKRFSRKEKGIYGSTIVNLQFTPMDKGGYCPIRIWAKIDDAMRILAKHLSIKVKPQPAPKRKFQVVCPYDEKGRYDKSKKMVLNLAMGKKVKIVQPGAVNYGFVGEVFNLEKHAFIIRFKDRSRRLGNWWMHSAMEGKLKQLPLVNVNPKFQKK